MERTTCKYESIDIERSIFHYIEKLCKAKGLKRDFITFYDCSLYEQERTHYYYRSFPFRNVIRAGKMRFIAETRLDDATLLVRTGFLFTKNNYFFLS